MRRDPFDDLIQDAFPPLEVTPQRIDRLIGGVMARLDDPPRRPFWLALLLPFSRFALPMAAAAALGVVVGQDLNPPEPLSLFSATFLSISYSSLGS